MYAELFIVVETIPNPHAAVLLRDHHTHMKNFQVVAVIVSLLWLAGCAAKKPATGYIAAFQNCRVTAKNADGTLASCFCGKYTLGTDAKTGKPVAICSGK